MDPGKGMEKKDVSIRQQVCVFPPVFHVSVNLAVNFDLVSLVSARDGLLARPKLSRGWSFARGYHWERCCGVGRCARKPRRGAPLCSTHRC